MSGPVFQGRNNECDIELKCPATPRAAKAIRAEDAFTDGLPAGDRALFVDDAMRNPVIVAGTVWARQVIGVAIERACKAFDGLEIGEKPSHGLRLNSVPGITAR